MSRTAVLVSLATSWPLRAQTVDALRERVDSLRHAWQEASAFADLQDSLHLVRAMAGRETLRVGGLTILVNRSPLPIREAAVQAWPIILRLFGPSAQAMVSRPIVIEAIDPDTSVRRPPLDRAVQLKWDIDTPALTRWLLNYVSGMVTDHALREWLGGPLLYDTLAARRASQEAYIELVTTASLAVRQCFQSDVNACRAALSISDSGDLLTRWYDRAERREVIAKAYGPVSVSACAAEDDSTCIDLLRALPPGHLQPPLDYAARLALVSVAIQAGGPGAVGRLLDAPDRSISVRLSAAAQMSAEALTRRWLEQARAARPAPVLIPPGGAWFALAWVGFFATCGLRSSRWRVS